MLFQDPQGDCIVGAPKPPHHLSCLQGLRCGHTCSQAITKRIAPWVKLGFRFCSLLLVDALPETLYGHTYSYVQIYIYIYICIYIIYIYIYAHLSTHVFRVFMLVSTFIAFMFTSACICVFSCVFAYLFTCCINIRTYTYDSHDSIYPSIYRSTIYIFEYSQRFQEQFVIGGARQYATVSRFCMRRKRG